MQCLRWGWTPDISCLHSWSDCWNSCWTSGQKDLLCSGLYFQEIWIGVGSSRKTHGWTGRNLVAVLCVWSGLVISFEVWNLMPILRIDHDMNWWCATILVAAIVAQVCNGGVSSRGGASSLAAGHEPMAAGSGGRAVGGRAGGRAGARWRRWRVYDHSSGFQWRVYDQPGFQWQSGWKVISIIFPTSSGSSRSSFSSIRQQCSIPTSSRCRWSMWSWLGCRRAAVFVQSLKFCIIFLVLSCYVTLLQHKWQMVTNVAYLKYCTGWNWVRSWSTSY